VNKSSLLLGLFVVLGIGIVLASQVLQIQGIDDSVQWWTSFDEGIATAQAEESLVLVEFYADWCGRCQDFERETWRNPDVIQLINDEFVCVKVDVDLNSTLRNHFQVTSLPTVVFLTSSGVELGRIGYAPASEFLDYATQIVIIAN